MLAHTLMMSEGAPSNPQSARRSEETRLAELLAYEAPFLETKLQRLGLVRNRPEAWGLLMEVKKYLYLADRNRGVRLPMPSGLVDEAWHQFVLFASEYAAFSMRFFGRYMHHHRRSHARGVASGSDRPEATLEDLATAYRVAFGVEMPDVWRDAPTR